MRRRPISARPFRRPVFSAGGGIHPPHVFTEVSTGFSAELNEGQLDALQHNPNVVA